MIPRNSKFEHLFGAGGGVILAVLGAIAAFFARLGQNYGKAFLISTVLSLIGTDGKGQVTIATSPTIFIPKEKCLR